MSRYFIIATTALTPMIWGTTYIVTTELLPQGRPLLAATLRALPIGLLFVLWKRQLPTGIWWWRSLVLGTLNIGGFFVLLFVAAYRLPGGVAATAGAVQPLLAAGLAALLIGAAPSRWEVLAGMVGLLGVGLLVLGPEAALDTIGVLAALGGAASMASGVVLTKRWERPVDLVTFTGWQLAAGGLLLAPFVLLVEGLPEQLDITNVLGFAWLTVVGTGMAYANWFRGIGRLEVTTVSLLGLLSPVVATAIGWWWLDQGLGPVQLLGGGLVVGAIVLPHLHHRSPQSLYSSSTYAHMASTSTSSRFAQGAASGSLGSTGEPSGNTPSLTTRRKSSSDQSDRSQKQSKQVIPAR